MEKKTSLIIASVLMFMLALGLVVRNYSQRSQFEKSVRAALKTSEGYDQRFIDMVNRLEYELAVRASFGYTGGKDPMTGKERTVLVQASPVRRRTTTIEVVAPPVVVEEVDPVRLTAIIREDVKDQFTAIVMHLERSFSVEVGDSVAGRKITKITNDKLYMEDDIAFYTYDITGGRSKKLK